MSKWYLANQRLVNEDWLALGKMKSFDMQHTVTLPAEGVSQVWNRVTTDNDILSYIADTLLILFQDKKCLSYGYIITRNQQVVL